MLGIVGVRTSHIGQELTGFGLSVNWEDEFDSVVDFADLFP